MPLPSAKRQKQRQFGGTHRPQCRTPPTCHCEAPKGPWQSREGTAVPHRLSAKTQLAFPVLTLPCTARRCTAGRGMPLPYIGNYRNRLRRSPSGRGGFCILSDLDQLILARAEAGGGILEGRVRIARHAAAHFGAGLVQRDGVERGKHADIRDDRHVVLWVAVAVR